MKEYTIKFQYKACVGLIRNVGSILLNHNPFQYKACVGLIYSTHLDGQNQYLFQYKACVGLMVKDCVLIVINILISIQGLCRFNTFYPRKRRRS